MGISERRTEIMKILCRRRHETVANLAKEFGVSERTISRDIEKLSYTEPIYTQCGRYGGGVYVTDNYSITNIYMKDDEISVLKKAFESVQSENVCKLNDDERSILKNIISTYTKPKVKRQ